MKRQLLFLINPISGANKKRRLFELIERTMNARALDFEIRHTDPLGEYVDLKREIAQSVWTDVVVAGGDGSVQAVASLLFGTTVRLGIIPAGSGNGMAYGAGISSNWKRAINQIVRGKAYPTDGYEVNGEKGCMLMGLGYDARVAEAFVHQRKRGFWRYIQICWSLFFEDNSYRMRIHTSEGVLEGTFFFISFANSNQFGNRVTIAPKADMRDGKLDLILVSSAPAVLKIFGLIYQILFGRPVSIAEAKRKTSIVRYVQAAKIEIENLDVAPLHVDGEPKPTAERIEVEVLPSAFWLMK
jgi:diacylglycerol kinase family enzyme